MLLLPSCTKERDPEDIITSTTWRLISFNNPIDPILLLDCDLDDCYRFKTDGTVIRDEGPTICEDKEIDQTIFSWSLSENGHIITFDGWSCPVDVSEYELFIGCEIFTLTFIPCTSTEYIKESKKRKEILLSHKWIDDTSWPNCRKYNQDGTITHDFNEIWTWEWSEYGIGWTEFHGFYNVTYSIESITKDEIVATAFYDSPIPSSLFDPLRVTLVPCE